MTIYSLILAAGKGKRLNSTHRNKVVLDFNGKPLIQYGIELFNSVCEKTFIVVGAYGDSVMTAVKEWNSQRHQIHFITQYEQLGTGHAVKVALEYLQNNKDIPDLIFVGYGDHLMYYPKEILHRLTDCFSNKKTVVSLVTTEYEKPEELSWGHILRNKNGDFIGFVEHKDADENQKKISELNAGLYCFDFNFLLKSKDELKKSDVSGEYYINDFADLALQKGYKVNTVTIPFDQVGIGINTYEQKTKSEEFYTRLRPPNATNLT